MKTYKKFKYQTTVETSDLHHSRKHAQYEASHSRGQSLRFEFFSPHFWNILSLIYGAYRPWPVTLIRICVKNSSETTVFHAARHFKLDRKWTDVSSLSLCWLKYKGETKSWKMASGWMCNVAFCCYRCCLMILWYRNIFCAM